jgi:hypothetical protein
MRVLRPFGILHNFGHRAGSIPMRLYPEETAGHEHGDGTSLAQGVTRTDPITACSTR